MQSIFGIARSSKAIKTTPDHHCKKDERDPGVNKSSRRVRPESDDATKELLTLKNVEQKNGIIPL